MIVWKIWTDAGTETKAQRVLERVLDRLGVGAEVRELRPYAKLGGFVLTLAVEIRSVRWADRVLEALLIGQRVGRAWRITGSANEELNATTEEASVSGVVLMEWVLDRNASDSAA
ncbi:MAG: hypothetical protein ACNS61_00440 [Candidatus Wenzhouxiangella sp. M2_3B_020]